MKFNTKCVHGSGKPDNTGAISPAIYMSSTFSHPSLGDTTGFQYSRESNPTRERLETLMANLEEGTDALAFSSGMAAIDAVFHLFSPGDHVIVGDDLYGGSIRMFTNVYEQNGIEFTYVGTSDLDAVRAAFKENTKAVFVETPTNPMMEITDIRGIVDIAHARNALVIIDNTFLSPYFQKPLTLGADIVVHSGTKFIGGHHDVISGFYHCER
nr:PLP-dependent aspartate aminotransferase family protein [Veillonella agrestimuris]